MTSMLLTHLQSKCRSFERGQDVVCPLGPHHVSHSVRSWPACCHADAVQAAAQQRAHRRPPYCTPHVLHSTPRLVNPRFGRAGCYSPVCAHALNTSQHKRQETCCLVAANPRAVQAAKPQCVERQRCLPPQVRPCIHL